jgi:hypothetical protein
MSDTEASGFFEVKVAHYFILGCALFSIFWGVINAILVSHFYFLSNLCWYHRLKTSKSLLKMMALGITSKPLLQEERNPILNKRVFRIS